MASHRVVDLITEARSNLHSDHSRLAFTGTTSSAGSSTTFVASALDSSLLDRKEILFTSGTNQGLRRIIDSWDNSTKTGTLLEALPAASGSGTTFQIGDSGFFSDFDFLPWLQAAINVVLKLVHPNALEELVIPYEANAVAVGGTDYGKVELPTDGHLSILKDVLINSVPSVVYDRAADAWNFQRNRFIDRGLLPIGTEDETQFAYVKPKPDTGDIDEVTVKIRYVQKILVSAVSDTLDFPEKIKDAIIYNVVMRAWKKRERSDMVTLARNLFRDELTALKVEE